MGELFDLTTGYHRCGYLLYDEQVMAGWTPDESNLNTSYALLLLLLL